MGLLSPATAATFRASNALFHKPTSSIVPEKRVLLLGPLPMYKGRVVPIDAELVPVLPSFTPANKARICFDAYQQAISLRKGTL